MTMPTKEQLAERFASILRRWIEDPRLRDGEFAGMTAQEAWDHMKKLNRLEPGRNAEHGFCNANMAMYEAFCFFGIDPLPADQDGMSDEVTDLWNAAWDVANVLYLS